MAINPTLQALQCACTRVMRMQTEETSASRSRASRIVYACIDATWALALACAVAASCSAQTAPATYSRPWVPTKAPLADDVRRLPMDEITMDPNATYNLGEIIDVAEEHNPLTRVAWRRAKAQAAAVGVARSDLFPTLTAEVLSETEQIPPLLYNTFVTQDIGLYLPSLSLSYTILDFNERLDKLRAAHAKLLAANYGFNNTHLQIIYQVTLAYYRLQDANGQLEAAKMDLEDAKALQDAAEARLANGLETMPNVLLTRSQTAEAQYDIAKAEDAQRVAFGDMATAMAAPPNVYFKVEDFNDIKVPAALDEPVEQDIDRALQQRPDLLQRVAQVRAARDEVKRSRAAFYPKITFDGKDGNVRAWGHQLGYPSTYGGGFFNGGNVYDAKLSLKWTIFSGWQRHSELAQAKQEEAQEEADVNETRHQIADQVWQSYSDLQAAFSERQAALAFVTAASESYSADLDSYKSGVQNILDVLNTSRTLAHARSSEVTTRAQVLGKMAQLAFRTGDLLTTNGAGTRP